jgi:bifunctional N-acetylglucosamine-1-phosphate-uridyltransferase/glucosamine-1-phosphate-acetyltransferase GlmU-like protein
MIVAGKNAVYIGKGATVGPNAHIDAAKGSVCVGAKVTMRQGSYLRELCLIASKATIGNSCEIKCALIGPEAEVPHFNYVGDSILGYKAHMGAGVKISNLKITPDPKKVNTVKVRYEGANYDSGMRKLGVILGDKAQLGCNTVTNPGTFVGKNVLVYSNSSVVGFIPTNRIVKLRQTMEESELKLS